MQWRWVERGRQARAFDTSESSTKVRGRWQDTENIWECESSGSWCCGDHVEVVDHCWDNAYPTLESQSSSWRLTEPCRPRACGHSGSFLCLPAFSVRMSSSMQKHPPLTPLAAARTPFSMQPSLKTPGRASVDCYCHQSSSLSLSRAPIPVQLFNELAGLKWPQTGPHLISREPRGNRA